MTSVLETLSLKELYTRKKNLIFQLEKVDEAIKKKLENISKGKIKADYRMRFPN